MNGPLCDEQHQSVLRASRAALAAVWPDATPVQLDNAVHLLDEPLTEAAQTLSIDYRTVRNLAEELREQLD